MMRNLILVVVFVALAAGAYGAWKAFSFLNYRSGTAQEELILDVPPGRTFIAVAQELAEKNLIKDVLSLRIYAKLTGNDRGLKVGEYLLHRGMGPHEILRVLSSGQSLPRTVTIPEGTNMYEVAGLLEEKGLGSREDYIELFKNQDWIFQLLGQKLYSLEGYLFPETYHFSKYMTQKEIVRAMVKMFLDVYNEVKVDGFRMFNRHEVVTLASVIEKETGAKDERPLISSVFHNRLKKRMRLQSDPTILYGILDETGVMKKNITRADITRKNRFNTYTISGLPFGPIANPGREALAAVFRPVESNYLYFVSRNDGTHVFSSTLKEHNQAVRKFQLDRRAREGKSWRDLEQ